ncbi:expressed unknown protein [Seminavis robusta]|uniref:Uncharacterized protein n=1 Tax=Seminavis robusta TaxID=568900 RepID=A0A9N8HGB3_9STRA|nr:expressed unknown protein [Seminavis robusta]|eukprot:Sro475_g150450.1 n/a (173) ;mRNA; f:44416-44934
MKQQSPSLPYIPGMGFIPGGNNRAKKGSFSTSSVIPSLPTLRSTISGGSTESGRSLSRVRSIHIGWDEELSSSLNSSMSSWGDDAGLPNPCAAATAIRAPSHVMGIGHIPRATKLSATNAARRYASKEVLLGSSSQRSSLQQSRRQRASSLSSSLMAPVREEPQSNVGVLCN